MLALNSIGALRAEFFTSTFDPTHEYVPLSVNSVVLHSSKASKTSANSSCEVGFDGLGHRLATCSPKPYN